MPQDAMSELTPLNRLARRAHETAMDKGFYDNPAEIDGMLMNIVGEAAEAHQIWRSGADIREITRSVHFGQGKRAPYERIEISVDEVMVWWAGTDVEPARMSKAQFFDIMTSYGADVKPEGFPIELIDILLRVLDMCAYLGIDADSAIEEKMRYNDTREYRHGGRLS